MGGLGDSCDGDGGLSPFKAAKLSVQEDGLCSEQSGITFEVRGFFFFATRNFYHNLFTKCFFFCGIVEFSLIFFYFNFAGGFSILVELLQ